MVILQGLSLSYDNLLEYPLYTSDRKFMREDLCRKFLPSGHHKNIESLAQRTALSAAPWKDGWIFGKDASLAYIKRNAVLVTVC